MPSFIQIKELHIMALHCPNCHSKKIGTKNHGKKAGGAIGTAAGANHAVKLTYLMAIVAI
jgi:hypothetical protein